MNENNNTLCQSLCDTGKAVHRRKCIAANAYIEKEELKSISPSTSRKKNSKLYQSKEKEGTIKIRLEINEIKNRKTIENIKKKSAL